jgi:putative transposase
MQQDQLTTLRSDGSYEWLACDIMRDPLRRVDRAFKAFFRRCKSGEKPGCPRFRSRDRYHSFAVNLPVVRERSIRIPKLGDIRIRGGRPVSGVPKVLIVKRVGTRWDVRVVCDLGPSPERGIVASAVGIDLGVSAFVTLSDGRQIENPRWTKQSQKKLTMASQRVARKKKGSKNCLKAKELLRRAYQSAANARLNYCHHVSKWLVDHYDLIAHENLAIRNLTRSAKGTVEKPGRNVAQKSGLNRSILDAAWGILLHQLAYKAESAGRTVIRVNPRGTSQRCSQCGQTIAKTLAERRHICVCGTNLDRDHNAALNILRLGEALRV